MAKKSKHWDTDNEDSGGQGIAYEIELGVKDYLLRRPDIPDTLKRSFAFYANSPQSNIGLGSLKKRDEWAKLLEKFRYSPAPF